MVRNTGENFSHPGFCRSCMGAMMDVPHEEILKGEDHLTSHLAANADSKTGALTTWQDTDSAEVEIMLLLPSDVTKKDLRVKSSVTKLLVAAGERKLLFVDPLFDDVVPDEMVWLIEKQLDGSSRMQISLVKHHPGTRWGKTLCKEGGSFECWKNQLLEAPRNLLLTPKVVPDALPVSVDELAAAGGKLPMRPKPRFYMRDDGADVEVNLPLPVGITSKKVSAVRGLSATVCH